MPRVIRNAGAATARNLGSQLLGEGLRTRDRADELHLQTILAERGKIDSIAESVNEFTRHQLDERAKRKEGRAGKKSAVGGMIGMAAAVVAAPFTGGASLALIPAAGALGQAVGSSFEDDPNAGLRASEQVGTAARAAGGAAENSANRQAAKDVAGIRNKRDDIDDTEEPLGAFFPAEQDEGDFGYEEGPAAEAGKTAGVTEKGFGQQEAAKPAGPIDIGFGVVWDPTTGEFGSKGAGKGSSSGE